MIGDNLYEGMTPKSKGGFSYRETRPDKLLPSRFNNLSNKLNAKSEKRLRFIDSEFSSSKDPDSPFYCKDSEKSVGGASGGGSWVKKTFGQSLTSFRVDDTSIKKNSTRELQTIHDVSEKSRSFRSNISGRKPTDFRSKVLENKNILKITQDNQTVLHVDTPFFNNGKKLRKPTKAVTTISNDKQTFDNNNTN